MRHLVSSSGGPAIGGAAGTDASAATKIYFEKEANVNIHCGYSGYAVGGAAYDGKDDSTAGNVYYNGGNVRVYLDSKAEKNTDWTSWVGSGIKAGVNDAAVTAKRVDSDGNAVYALAFDTSLLSTAADTYTVACDDTEIYSGAVNSYAYLQEAVDGGQEISETTTVSNWVSSDDATLYFYLTGEDHTLTVNNESINVIWNSSDESFTVVPSGYKPVYFFCEQSDVESYKLKVSDYKTEATLYPCTKTVTETADGVETQVEKSGYVTYLPAKGTVIDGTATAGAYTYTATAEGYYGSTCGFTLNADGTVKFTTTWSDSVKSTYGIADLLDTANATFNIDLDTFTPSTNKGAWDGITIDVSWYDGSIDAGKSYEVSTPAQPAGLAALVNGIYNDEVEYIIDNVEGTTKTYTVDEYNKLSNRKIYATCSSGDGSGPNGQNQVTSSDFYYNYKPTLKHTIDFDGQTVNITADLDMGWLPE